MGTASRAVTRAISSSSRGTSSIACVVLSMNARRSLATARRSLASTDSAALRSTGFVLFAQPSSINVDASLPYDCARATSSALGVCT